MSVHLGYEEDADLDDFEEELRDMYASIKASIEDQEEALPSIDGTCAANRDEEGAKRHKDAELALREGSLAHYVVHASPFMDVTPPATPNRQGKKRAREEDSSPDEAEAEAEAEAGPSAPKKAAVEESE